MVITADPSPKRVLPKPEVLRRNVVERLERLNDEQIGVVHDWFLQLELEQAFKELSQGIAEDEEAGKLTPELIQKSIQEYRLRHPYGR